MLCYITVHKSVCFRIIFLRPYLLKNDCCYTDSTWILYCMYSTRRVVIFREVHGVRLQSIISCRRCVALRASLRSPPVFLCRDDVMGMYVQYRRTSYDSYRLLDILQGSSIYTHQNLCTCLCFCPICTCIILYNVTHT